MACGRLSVIPNRSAVVSDENLRAASNVMRGVDLPFGDVTDLVLGQAQSTEPTEDATFNNLGLDLLETDSHGESFDRGVASILIGMDMQQYLPLFKQADICMDALLSLRDDDLLAIGVTNYAHREIISETIGPLRINMLRNRQNQGKISDLENNDKYMEMSTEDIFSQMCFSFKHINAVVLLLRHYHSLLKRGLVQNQLLDREHSAADAGRILSSEAITQAALLESQLRDLLSKVQSARPPDAATTPTKKKKKKKEQNISKNLATGAVAAVFIGAIVAAICYSRKF